MTLKNLTTTLDEGRMRTWRLPRRSALTILFRQSFYLLSVYKTLKADEATHEYGDANHDVGPFLMFSGETSVSSPGSVANERVDRARTLRMREGGMKDTLN